MADPLYQIVLAACELKAAAPRSYEELVAGFSTYEAKCIDELLAAGPNDIFGAQSTAKVVRQLKTKLQNCMQLRDTNEKRK